MTILNEHTRPVEVDRRTCLAGAASLLAATMAAGSARGQELGVALPPTVTNHDGMGRWFDAVPGERMTVHASGADTGGALSILESIIAPGCATPLHYHSGQEVILVLEGALRVVIGNAHRDFRAGSAVVVGGGEHHGFVNRTSTPVRTIAIFAPGGIDAMFVQLGMTPPAEWSDLAGRFGTVIVGPPIVG